MGARDFAHKFNHYDWRIGIKELQQKADEEYGHQQGYSGEINSVSDFSIHRPKVTFKNEKQLWSYIQERLENHVQKREGEVIDLGITAYSIAKPVVKEYYGYLQLDANALRGVKEPAILVNYMGWTVAKGTLAELKEKAKVLVMKEKFEHDYFIVGKNTSKIFVVTGEGRVQKKTTQKSNANQLVLPLHDWVVYGIAPS